MIESLKVKNFQSHKDSELQFHHGVNIVVGTTDSGKTAVLRALKWVIRNRPSGEGFRSHWGGKTRVDLKLSDGEVSREKDKENLYFLNGTRFTAFGSDVPQEITKAINIEDTNLQSQMDAPFLLSKSAGEVAAHFNKVAHLDQIGVSQKYVDSRIRNLNQSILSYKDRITENKEKLEQYADLDKLEMQIEVLEDDQSKLQNLFSARISLEKILEGIRYYSGEIAQIYPLISSEKRVFSLLNTHEKRKALENDAEALENLLQKIDWTTEGIQEHQEIIPAGAALTKILGLYEKKKALTKDGQELKLAVDRLDTVTVKLQTAQKELEKLEEDFHKNFPDICPLCGAKQKKK